MLLVLVGLLFLSSCASSPKESSQKQEATQTTTTSSQAVTEVKSTTPTLFIHGYSGGASSFGSMIERLETAGVAQKEMVISVDATGGVTSQGELSGEATNPLIQVLFEDNVNNEWNQATWILNVLQYLQITQDVTSVNLVGHSMGGVSSYRYLATNAQADVPQVEKFVAIGAPFNEFLDTSASQSVDQLLTAGPSEQSPRYQDFANLSSSVPAGIECLVIGGQVSSSDLSDGTVPLTSALAGVPLLKMSGETVQSQIIVGENAHHSQLHENEAVDQVVSEFLWSK